MAAACGRRPRETATAHAYMVMHVLQGSIKIKAQSQNHNHLPSTQGARTFSWSTHGARSVGRSSSMYNCAQQLAGGRPAARACMNERTTCRRCSSVAGRSQVTPPTRVALGCVGTERKVICHGRRGTSPIAVPRAAT
jgi:hypothetical protein